MTIRIGILGAGNISETHARAAAAIEDVEIVAVHGVKEQRVERLATTYHARAYTDLDAFLSHQPMDLVAIGSPSGLHAEQGIRAAGRGLHVLTEKPIDVSVSRADALRGCREILEGRHDDLPAAAFYFTGSIEEIRRASGSP